MVRLSKRQLRDKATIRQAREHLDFYEEQFLMAEMVGATFNEKQKGDMFIASLHVDMVRSIEARWIPDPSTGMYELNVIPPLYEKEVLSQVRMLKKGTN